MDAFPGDRPMWLDRESSIFDVRMGFVAIGIARMPNHRAVITRMDKAARRRRRCRGRQKSQVYEGEAP